VFYAYVGVGYLVLLLVMTTLTFLSGRFLLTSAIQSRRRIGLWLIFFKYANILAAPLSDSVLNIVLPLGISFYTFNLVSYDLDAYRKLAPAKTNTLNFLTHMTFFPSILSGPLIRYNSFHGQTEICKADWDWLMRRALGIMYVWMIDIRTSGLL
jgi:alginate O-acetyltransferase complex protein AlgI